MEYDSLLKEAIKITIESANKTGSVWKSDPKEPYGLRLFNPSRSENTQRFKDMKKNFNYPVYITAYTDPTNLASEKVLTKNGFENIGVYEYKGEKDNLWILEI